jgi:hypothetical protein
MGMLSTEILLEMTYADLLRWHQDVKPANIVSSTPGNSPYAGKLRTSDLGSHFKPPKKENVVDARDASCHC